MEAYIKSFSSFTLLRQCSTTDYQIVLDSLDSQNSSITVDGDDIPGTIAGNWLLLNGIPMRIAVVTPGKGLTKFTLEAADEIFNRQLLSDTWTDTSIGDFIARIIDDEWIQQSDSAYAVPYLEVESLDNTAFEAPEVDENGIWNFLAYIRAMRQKYNITLHWSVERRGLKVTIDKDTSVTYPLVLGDGHSQLASSSFASSIVSKITVLQPVEVPQNDPDAEPVFEWTSTDWYLAQDGTASTTVPVNRADGEWITIVVGEEDDQSEAVQAEFAKNGESHKVELYSDQSMNVNDRFKIKLNGEVFDGAVIRKSIKKGDRRVLYTSGDLITTIQERVHQTAAAQGGGYTGDGTGQMYAVGDIYITTRSGNPATLLGYGAWEQIQGRFLFAADSNHAVKSKGGSSEVTLEDSNLPKKTITANISGAGGIYRKFVGSISSGTSNAVAFVGSSTPQATVTLNSSDPTPLTIVPPYFAIYVWLRKE